MEKDLEKDVIETLKAKQQEVYERMVKDINWSIEYHTEKLEEAKLQLKVLTESNL